MVLSMVFDVLVVPIWYCIPSSVYVGILRELELILATTAVNINLLVRLRASRQKYLLLPEGWPIFRVDLSAKIDLIKKVPHECAQQVRFQLIPTVVKFPTKISNHNWCML